MVRHGANLRTCKCSMIIRVGCVACTLSAIEPPIESSVGLHPSTFIAPKQLQLDWNVLGHFRADELNDVVEIVPDQCVTSPHGDNPKALAPWNLTPKCYRRAGDSRVWHHGHPAKL